ncbi:MAG TPA: transglutaminase-like domain-containing protein [Acidobacteriota bacterium]|nr:transglutaminase-like domain-containing protein [Acidobacteriota bacterium]
MIIDYIKARQAFQQIAELDETAFPLDRAALDLCLDDYPELDIRQYLYRLDTLAARVEVLTGKDRRAVNFISSINTVLFVQEGLRGNVEDYFDPRNSFLNEVLDRRLGIPISLSVVYMEVARRIGFPVVGIGFPGHFLVKHVDEGNDIIIDAFNGGRVLTMNECRELMDKIHDGALEMNDSFFQPMAKRAIVTRMLYNLKGIYMEKENHFKALTVIEKILMLNPGTPSEIRDRGLLYMQTGLFARALADLETYLTRVRAPEDLSSIQSSISTLRGIVSTTN